MGTRRLPMGDKPVSIGSSPSCDVVLPEREDVALEHALVWQHGTRVILHAGLSADLLRQRLARDVGPAGRR